MNELTRPPSKSRCQRARRRTADILFSRRKEDAWTRCFDIGLILLVSLNVMAVILESVAAISDRWGSWFHAFEIFSVGVFSMEYALRVWSAVDEPWQDQYRHPVIGRLRFMRTWMALVDLLAILPFYLGLLIPVDLRFLRVLRLLRIFKLTRYSGSMNLLFQVLRQEGRTIGAAMFVLLMLLVIASSLAFIVEVVSSYRLDQRLEARAPANIATTLVERHRHPYEMLPEEVVGSVRVVRERPGEHLEQHHSKRIDIGARVDRITAHRLGGDIGRRA